jgi:hypothetical protein
VITLAEHFVGKMILPISPIDGLIVADAIGKNDDVKLHQCERGIGVNNKTSTIWTLKSGKEKSKPKSVWI